MMFLLKLFKVNLMITNVRRLKSENNYFFIELSNLGFTTK